MFNLFWFSYCFVWNEFNYIKFMLPSIRVRTKSPKSMRSRSSMRSAVGDAGLVRPIVSKKMIALNVYAEKGPRSTWGKMPAQHTYRSKADWDRFIAIVERYRAQQRPYIQFGAAGPIPATIPAGPAGDVRVRPDGSIHYTGLEEPEPAVVTGAV